MVETLKQRIESVTKEASDLAEQWAGTLHEQLIREDMENLLKRLEQPTHESCLPLIEKLENTLARTREEVERSDNES